MKQKNMSILANWSTKAVVNTFCVLLVSLFCWIFLRWKEFNNLLFLYFYPFVLCCLDVRNSSQVFLFLICNENILNNKFDLANIFALCTASAQYRYYATHCPNIVVIFNQQESVKGANWPISGLTYVIEPNCCCLITCRVLHRFLETFGLDFEN